VVFFHGDHQRRDYIGGRTHEGFYSHNAMGEKLQPVTTMIVSLQPAP
jgi:hypothetical protein